MNIEIIFIVLMGVLFLFYYLRQECINRVLFTFLLRNRDQLDRVIKNTYINDAVRIKKILKRNFDNMIDVDNDPIFKDIGKEK